MVGSGWAHQHDDLARAKLTGKHPFKIPKCFEFQRHIARCIDKKCALFTGFSLKPHLRLDAKIQIGAAQSFDQCVPVIPGQHHAEMRHGHGFIVDGTCAALCHHGSALMQRELMPEQIKVDPRVCFPAPLTTKNVLKEGRCCCQVGDRKGQMKGG